MERTTANNRSLRNAVRLGLSSRLGVEADSFEVAVIEIEQFRIRNGGASMLERIRKSRAIEGVEVGQEPDEFARQRRRFDRSRVCRNSRLGHRGNRSHRTVEWDDGRKKHEQNDYENDVLYPPEYPRYRWHVTPPQRTQQDFSTRTMVSAALRPVKRQPDEAFRGCPVHAGVVDRSGESVHGNSSRVTHKTMRESEDGARCQ